MDPKEKKGVDSGNEETKSEAVETTKEKSEKTKYDVIANFTVQGKGEAGKVEPKEYKVGDEFEATEKGATYLKAKKFIKDKTK